MATIEDQEKRSEFYDKVFAGKEFREGKKERTTYLDEISETLHYEYIADRILQEGFNNILEIGVGGGKTLKYIHEKVPNVKLTGMDISKNILEEAQSHFNEWSMKVDLFLGDAYDMSDIKDDQFDAVLLIDVIEHLEDPVKALKEANRMASREVIINVPSRQSLYTLLSSKLRERIVYLETVVQYWLGHYRLYTYKSLEEEVNKASMEIVAHRSVRPISVNIYPFWRLKRLEKLVSIIYKASIELDKKTNFNPKFIGNSILVYCRRK